MSFIVYKRLRHLNFYQLPSAAVWYLKRRLRYFIWGVINRFSIPAKLRKVGKNVRFNGLVRVEHPHSRIDIGDDTMLGRNCYFLTSRTGSITIGKSVSINDLCYITSCFEISIGDNTSIAEMVSIRDYNHEYRDPNITIKSQGIFGSPIIIEEDVWLGKGVTVLPGVTIGKGSIIGAHAVVNRDIPPNSIAVGVPARVIRSRS